MPEGDEKRTDAKTQKYDDCIVTTNQYNPRELFQTDCGEGGGGEGRQKQKKEV